MPKSPQTTIKAANKRRDRIRDWINQYKHASGCIACGEDHPVALEFHHVRGKKEFDVSTGYSDGYSPDRIAAEVAKCDILCRNCHSRQHWHQKFVARDSSQETEEVRHSLTYGRRNEFSVTLPKLKPKQK